MAQFLPDRIQLSSAEAFDVVAALDAAYRVLVTSDWLGVALEVEEAHALLVSKLFPEAGG